MEKQFRDEDDEPAPPYEESDITPRPVEKPTQRSPNSSTTQERAAEIRRQRVKLLVDGHVEPLLESAVLLGSSHTIMIVPSDAIESKIVLTASNLVHRPKSSSTHIIQLRGSNSTGLFWTQSKVVEELEAAIRGSLYGINDTSQLTERLPPRPANLSSPVSDQKSWLKRTFGMPGPDHDPTGSTGDWRLGWRSEQTSSQQALHANEPGPLVMLKEVAFRTETELGLLTTTTAKCIIIQLESST